MLSVLPFHSYTGRVLHTQIHVAQLAQSARDIGCDGNIFNKVIARAEGGGGIGHAFTQTDFVEGAGAGGKLKFVAYLRAESILVGETGGAGVVAGFEGEEGRVIRR